MNVSLAGLSSGNLKQKSCRERHFRRLRLCYDSLIGFRKPRISSRRPVLLRNISCRRVTLKKYPLSRTLSIPDVAQVCRKYVGCGSSTEADCDCSSTTHHSAMRLMSFLKYDPNILTLGNQTWLSYVIPCFEWNLESAYRYRGLISHLLCPSLNCPLLLIDSRYND